MKKNMFGVLFIIICVNIFATKLDKYTAKSLFTIPIGKDEAQITMKYSNKKMGVASGPGSLNIGNDDYIYICDNLNARFQIFDKKGNFINLINVVDSVHKSSLIEVTRFTFDSDNNIIIFLSSRHSLLKIDQQGNVIFDKKKNELGKNVLYYRNLFAIEDNLLYYDDDYKIQMLNRNGKQLTDKEKNQVFEKLNQVVRSNSNKIKIIYKNKNKIVEYKEKFLTTDFNSIKPLLESKREALKKDNLTRNNVSNVFIDDTKFDDHQFLGFDGDNNSYWTASYPGVDKYVIVIYSSDGVILDYFSSDFEEMMFSVDSEGNIYTMTADFKKGVTIWQYPRMW